MRCYDPKLELLFSLDETSPEYHLLESHVEECPACQQRLLDLSSDGDFREEIKNTILFFGETEPDEKLGKSQVNILVEAASRMDGSGECEPISLDFLTPASHPEMLGRIGRYEVEKVIGSGGMGVVLKGYDTELHRVVAIKVLKPHLAHVGAARNRFAREAQSAAAVVHEHVIPIYDVRSDGEMPFLVMQFVPGQSLQSRVEERGPLEPKEILRIALQVASGLAAAHAQGLVHRDVKPANILLEESVERVLISDFGLARTVDDATLTRTGIVAGTPHYMSPEQSRGLSIDHRSDLFSLGSVVYFMCTGRPPFRAENALAVLNRICLDPHRPVDEVNHDIPAQLAATVDQLLAKDPADRFRNAREVEERFASILSQLQNGQPSRFLRWGRQWFRWRSAARRLFPKFLAAAACAVFGAGITWWLWSDPSAEDSVRRSGAARSEEVSERRNALEQIGPEPGMSRHQEVNSEVKSPPPAGSDRLQETIAHDINAEFSRLQAAVNQLEARWNPTSPDYAAVSPGEDTWYQDLESLRNLLQNMDEESSGTRIQSQHHYSSAVERKEE